MQPRILLATHGGRSAAGAVRLAALLAERVGAELEVVGVLEPLRPLDYGFGVAQATTAEDEEALAREILDGARAQLADCGLGQVEVALRKGTAAEQIAGSARAAEANLVVVGLGPHNAVERALGGETALQLVQLASAPVLAVPAEVTRLPRRIVAGIDFTPTSVRAARTASRLLAPGDDLHLVHVRTRAEAREEVAGEEWPEAGEGAATSLPAEDRLLELLDRLPLEPGVATHTALLEGSPAPVLLDYLARVHGDAVALGTHGYGLWKRLTLGSVSSKVLRVAASTVLVQPLGSLAVPSERKPPGLHLV